MSGGWKWFGSLFATCFEMFLEACGPLDWLSYLHPAPTPLSHFPQGKKSPGVLSLGAVGPALPHPFGL